MKNLKNFTNYGPILNNIVQLTIIVLLTINSFLVAYMGLQVASINKRIAFDMDKIRWQYEEDSKWYFREACGLGTDYPPEWREEQTAGWNIHTPVNYCNDNLDRYRDVIERNLGKLGK